ncbi:MAG: PIN domain-containing protein [Longimicrobiales bacterium]
MKIFVDVNVILDVLADREPWVEDSAAVLSLLELDGLEGVVAAHSITTLYYLTTKHLTRKRATASIVDLLKLVSVAPVTQDVLLKALSLGWNDFEDAVQGVCALDAGADYIITRDAGVFDGLSIPALTPAEFLALIGSAEAESEE